MHSRNKIKKWSFPLIAVLTTFAFSSPGQDTNPAAKLFGEALTKVASILSPASGQPPRTFSTTLKLAKGEGLPKEFAGREVQLAIQAPDRVRVSANIDRFNYVVGRNGQQVWIYAPENKFGLIGSPDVPRFTAVPDSKDTTPLEPLSLPVRPEQLMILPLIANVEMLPAESIGATACRVIKATPKPEAIEGFKLPRITLQLWLRESDTFPLRISVRDEKRMDVAIDLVNPQFSEAWPADKWNLAPADGDKLETVARSHLTRGLSVAMSMIGQKVPPLGPETGERKVLAREGAGRLEEIDGTRVLFLKGTPEEMGRQHGVLLKKEIRGLVDQMVYGVGVASSFEKKRWFFGEIEEAQKRLTPFMDTRYLREMDALAQGSGLPREEVRLANFFPELFHCSGFAVFGKATKDGNLYHGRVLDYLRGLGLEQNAVVMIIQPDKGNAWANVGYAGFVGSVTAMNEKRVAIGEMGGRGEGNWDGKPMAQLLREVMEKANTLDEAIEIMRKGPRTCEYYYVISDAKTRQAVGIAATSQKFEVILPGQAHPQLPHPVQDTVLMSAGDRYEELSKRVKAVFGKLDAQGARDLMRRPVCMTSNIHSALFAPDTLDFWVANADSENVAAHARYTRYNLAELLRPEKAQ